MNNCSTNNYSSRNRRCTKQPVYTSDKRAKFTQRENKKWIRFLTVLGYIFFVSLPALSLSIYYIYIWDPGYMGKTAHNDTGFPAKYFDPIKPDRSARDSDRIFASSESPLSTMGSHLEKILAAAASSMESSTSQESGT